MGDDNSWRTPSFRQNVVAKINEAIQSAGISMAKTSLEMENHVFQKSRSKDDYLSYIARLILHVRELNNKNKNPQNAPDGNNQGMPDPINALQNLASQGSRSTHHLVGINMTPLVGPGAPNPNVAMSGQTLFQKLQGQQQQQQHMQNMANVRPMGPMAGNMQQAGQMNSGPMGNAMAGMHNPMGSGNMNMQMGGNQMAGQMQNQSGQLVVNSMSNQMGGGQIQINQTAMQGQNNQMNTMNSLGQMGGMNQNQMNAQMNQINNTGLNAANSGLPVTGQGVGPTGAGQVGLNQNMAAQMSQMNPNQMSNLNANTVPGANQQTVPLPQQAQQQQQQQQGGMVQGGMMSQQGSMGPNQMTQNQMLNMQHMNRKAPEMMMTQPVNVFQGVRSVTPNQFLRQSPSPSIPSPAGMGGSHQNSQMVPSPALVPSPSPQLPNMLSNSQRSIGSVMAPSPSSSLNTPGQAGAVPSPVNSQEEQMYREKYRHLTKYIEPLKRMIARMGNDDAEKLLKMNKLLEILSNPNKRIPLETLIKCEKALEKMDFKPQSNANSVSMQATNTGQFKDNQINNPLLEAVNLTLQNPMGNHTLQRTFRPCLEALFGPDIKNLPPTAKQARLSYDDSSVSSNVPEIPHILQGEIARLDQKFKVTLDPSAQMCTKTIKLICCLDDKHLPCVPPICVTIPDSYPMLTPNCSLSEQEYSTPFLNNVQKSFIARISKLPRQFSLSQVLDTWEMSVRQACSPISVISNPTSTSVLMGF